MNELVYTSIIISEPSNKKTYTTNDLQRAGFLVRQLATSYLDCMNLIRNVVVAFSYRQALFQLVAVLALVPSVCDC
jgi:hypothetical protein